MDPEIDQYSLSFSVLDDVKTLILFLGFLFSLSPILKTLTDSISTDTIYAMTVRASLILVSGVSLISDRCRKVCMLPLPSQSEAQKQDPLCAATPCPHQSVSPILG